MNITYITHSCFLVELESCYLLFDYYKGKLPELKAQKPLYVFASHAHQDHYSSRIFELRNHAVTWILSNDIHTAHSHIQVAANREYDIDCLHVQTLSSTDEGVAFLVHCGSVCIYHAGDLNWWDWGKEDTPQESKLMKQQYVGEMRKLKGMHIDVAFVPVDPRLQERALKGVQIFLEYASCDLLVPMHFWKDTSIFQQLQDSEHIWKNATNLWLNFQELETFTKV